jgi:TonB-dependent receptor
MRCGAGGAQPTKVASAARAAPRSNPRGLYDITCQTNYLPPPVDQPSAGSHNRPARTDQTMNYLSALLPARSPLGLLRFATGLFLAFAAAAGAFAQATGAITGSVTSAETRNALQGAVVAIPSLNRTELTDSAGRFLIQNVPAGNHDLVINYNGFAELRRPVSVAMGTPARIDAEMKSSTGVVMMDAFTVATVKEGGALAVTQQRNASNIKHVTAMDEWGTLPTMSVAELAVRLPGISGDLDPEDNVLRNISIRGMSPDFTRMTIDGMSASAVGGNGRTATLYSFSGAMYEQIEIIAGQTPDKRADSIGGQFNLKTRSPLSMKEDRRSTYNVGFRWSPSFAFQTKYREDHPIHPVTSFSHQQVFSVFGGHRNLGIAVTGSYSESIGDKARDILLYESTTNPVAFFNDYQNISGLNHRIVYGINARADYRWSPQSKFTLSLLFNAGAEPFDVTTRFNAWTNSIVATFNAAGAPTNNGGVVPGYTANRTEIRPIPAGLAQTSSRMDIDVAKVSFYSRNPSATFSGDHDFGKIKLDYAARFSHTSWDLNHGSRGQGGQLTMRAENIGFTLDKSDLDGRVFTQTSGPSVYDPNSYTTNYVFTKRNRPTTITEGTANLHFTYKPETEMPLLLKAGGDFTERRFNAQWRGYRRWNRVAGAPQSQNVPLMPISRFELQHGGVRLPAFDPTAINNELGNPALWTEDLYFIQQQRYVSRLLGVETVPAAYLLGQTKIKGLTVLGGVRFEDVRTDNFTYAVKPAARQVSAAQQPDPALRAAANYTEVEQKGGYGSAFPSVHLAYDITQNVKARASWSTSYGRPTFQQMIPTFTVNEAAMTISGGNPDIKAQYSKNIDLKLEYYFRETGMFSVGVYQKKISDYLGANVLLGKVGGGDDNGFDGLYQGFDVFGPSNLGSAKVEGLEFDFRSRLTFLPGPLKGLTLSANYTRLRTEGKFEGTVQRSTREIAGFVPVAGNVRLFYTYRKFGASLSFNHTGEYLWLFSTLEANKVYREDYQTLSAGLSYRIRPNTTLSIDFNNLTEEGLGYYRYIPSRPRMRFLSGTTVNFGVSGTF